jgi:hypothetical protein
MCSRYILHQAKGGSSWSSPLRSDASQDDQVGEAVPVSCSSAEAKSLKTRVKGIVRLPLQSDSSQGSQTGAQRAEEKDYSHRMFTQKTELDNSSKPN